MFIVRAKREFFTFYLVFVRNSLYYIWAMASNEIKKLQESLDSKFKQLKDLIEIIVNKVRFVETHQGVMAEQMRLIRDQQSVINEKLDGHTASLINIEATLKGYADMYKVNKEKNEKLEERVETIEDQVGISKNN